MELGSVWLPDLRIVVWRGYSVKLGMYWGVENEPEGENLNTRVSRIPLEPPCFAWYCRLGVSEPGSTLAWLLADGAVDLVKVRLRKL